jgi:hypothetical protein
MAKPIFILNYCVEGLSKDMIIRNIKALKKVLDDSDIHDDYYVFMLPVREDSYVQVFYEKDFDPISYKELTDKIDKKIGELYGED